MEPTAITIALIAAACYEARRAYVEKALDDYGRPSWEHASEAQRDAVFKDVEFIQAHPGCSPAEVHDAWRIGKLNDGWTTGAKLDPVAKTHPGIVPYGELPNLQQAKKAIITAVAKVLLAAIPIEEEAQGGAHGHVTEELLAINGATAAGNAAPEADSTATETANTGSTIDAGTQAGQGDNATSSADQQQ